MHRLPVFSKLFKSKPLAASVEDSQAPKQTLTQPIFSKLKTSTKVRYHALRAALHTNTASSDYVDEDVSINNIDFPECLPAIDNFGTGLGLDFDQQHGWQAQSSSPATKDDSKATSSMTISGLFDSKALMTSPAQEIPDGHGQRLDPPTGYNNVGTRSSMSITLKDQDAMKIRPQPQASFAEISYGTTISSMIAVPESPLISHVPDEQNGILPQKENTSFPRFASPNVTLYPDNNTPSDLSETELGRNFHDSSPPLTVLDSDTSVSESIGDVVKDARSTLYEAASAVEAQQALLDYADVVATAAVPRSGERVLPMTLHEGKEMSQERFRYKQEIELAKIEQECLALTNVVQEHRNRRDQANFCIQQKDESAKVDKNGENSTQQSEDKTARLEMDVSKLREEKQLLQAEVELYKENRELTRKITQEKINNLETENRTLSLRNYSLEYNKRQSQAIHAEKSCHSESKSNEEVSDIALVNATAQQDIENLRAELLLVSEAGSRPILEYEKEICTKDEQLAKANIRIDELESTNAAWTSQGSIRFADLYKKKTGLSPDGWKAMMQTLNPLYYALRIEFKKVKAQLKEIEAKQERMDSTLREAQIEAWTQKHLHEETSRTLGLSKQMHKEANDFAAKLAKKYETLETRYEMRRKVSEQMLADSWHASASQDERITNLTRTLPSHHVARILDDKQIELHSVERRLITTQRLVEILNEHLTDTQTQYDELELGSKSLECQLGEAKVRLDLGSDNEARLEVELEKAKAKSVEYMACTDAWRDIAITRLDDYAPEVVGQVKQNTLLKLQKEIAEADVRNAVLTERNKTLSTHLDDLGYELEINERRLHLDESVKLDFYDQHWRTVEGIFLENKSKTATIKQFEARFADQLAKTPMTIPEIGDETIEDHLGPDFIDRTNALYRFIDEAREGRGEDDLRRSDLDTEKIKALYGHGPAGFKPRPEKGMPDGYVERKEMRENQLLREQVKDLKGKLWRLQRDWVNSSTGELGTEEAEDEMNDQMEMDGPMVPQFFNSI